MEGNGKLVRDRIPEIVAAEGIEAETRRLKAEERLPALFLKLDEERQELADASSTEHRTEELADVLEVLLAIAAESGIAWPDVEAAAEEKRKERGGFGGGIWMSITR